MGTPTGATVSPSSTAGVQTGFFSVDPGGIGGGARGAVAVAVPGLKPGDLVVLEPPLDLDPALVYAGFSVEPSVVTIFLVNISTMSIGPRPSDWRFVWVGTSPPVTETLGHDPR